MILCSVSYALAFISLNIKGWRNNMKIELYRVPNDTEGEKIKEFLIRNRLSFTEIVTDDISVLNKVAQIPVGRKFSLLKVTYSGAIGIIDGFNEIALNQLIEHIKKYNLKIKID